MKRLSCILFLVLTACLGTSCATTSSSEALRTRNIAPESQTDLPTNAIQFVSKGAFVTNISSSNEFQPGTWVRGVPSNELWPKNDTPPIVLTGRVVERNKKSARLELLTYADGIRVSYDVTAISYKPDSVATPANARKTDATALVAYPTHAITKRLVLPDQHDKTSAIVAQPGLNDIRGNEIYAAIDLDKTKDRLAASISAILRVDATNGEFANLTVIHGSIPEHSIFVLLDAFTEPGYTVDIVVHGVMQNNEVASQIESLIQDYSAAPFIRVSTDDATPTRDELTALLGKKRTTSLDVHLVISPNGVEMADQSLRLGFAPYPVMLSDNAQPGEIVLAAAWRALSMAGDLPGAANLLETRLTASDDASFARLAPALASTYHAIERDDWSLEIALEALARADNTKDSVVSAQLYAATAAIAAEIARPNEFKDAFKKSKSNIAKLSPSWKQLVYRAFTVAAISHESFLDDAHALYHQNDDVLDHYDEQLRCFALHNVDPTSCELGASSSKTPFDDVYFDGMMHLTSSAADDPEMTSILTALDDVGAPYVAQLFWLQLARHARNPETAETLMLNAIGYAHRAQNHRDEAVMAAEVRRSRAARGATSRDKALESAMRRWQSLDNRAQLAALCYETATQDAHSLDERNKLLNYAYQLYLSIGDATNAMACQAAMK